MEGVVLNGTYRVVRLIGEGGMGAVYEATHVRLPRRFAVKLLHREYSAHKEALGRFQREAEIASSLGHPNIAEVFDFNLTAEGEPYLVMEYLDGQDLAVRLEQVRAMSPASAATIISQAAAALEAAHKRQIVHRDLKPQNIFLISPPDGDGERVKLIDFGIAKVRAASAALTRGSTIMGTPHYMAPEQALGKMEAIGPATDQFALATVAYEMLTGRAPFRGDDISAILYQIIHEEPDPLPAGFGGDLWEVVRHGLSKKPEDRFASITAFARAFASAAGAAPMLTPMPMVTDATVVDTSHRDVPTTMRSTAGELGPDRPAGWSMTRGRGLLVGGGGAVLAAIVGVVLFSGPKHVDPAVPLPAAAPASLPAAPHAAVQPLAEPTAARVAPLPSGALDEARGAERPRTVEASQQPKRGPRAGSRVEPPRALTGEKPARTLAGASAAEDPFAAEVGTAKARPTRPPPMAVPPVEGRAAREAEPAVLPPLSDMCQRQLDGWNGIYKDLQGAEVSIKLDRVLPCLLDEGHVKKAKKVCDQIAGMGWTATEKWCRAQVRKAP